nr:MAG TPA: hypothetical protein [Caudoviricetes sp.]
MYDINHMDFNDYPEAMIRQKIKSLCIDVKFVKRSTALVSG